MRKIAKNEGFSMIDDKIIELAKKLVEQFLGLLVIWNKHVQWQPTMNIDEKLQMFDEQYSDYFNKTEEQKLIFETAKKILKNEVFV